MNKKQTVRLITTGYIIVFMFYVLMSLFSFVSDALGFKTGAIVSQTVGFQNAETKDLEVLSNYEATSVGSDSQIIYTNLKGEKFISATLHAKFYSEPNEVNLYYKKAGEEFSTEKKIWGKYVGDGVYDFQIPRTHIDELRLDPTCLTGVKMGSFRLFVNEQRSFLSYFKLTGEMIFRYILYTHLILAFIGYILTNFGGEVEKYGKQIYSTISAKLLRKRKKIRN